MSNLNKEEEEEKNLPNTSMMEGTLAIPTLQSATMLCDLIK